MGNRGVQEDTGERIQKSQETEESEKMEESME